VEGSCSLEYSCAKSFICYSKSSSFLVMTAAGRMDLFRQVVRNMLAALDMPDVGDDELDDLTLRVGHAGKL
jgi:hypothetical protein